MAQETMRALRGQRSQVAFSRRLGYRSNVAAEWESGRRFPNALEVLRAAEKTGVDVDALMNTFELQAAEIYRADGLSAWLGRLQGSATQADVSQRTGCSRHQVGRWLRGTATPRLPDFLALIDALTGRLGDFVDLLVGPIPSVQRHVALRRAVSRIVFTHPWSAAVLGCIEAMAPARPADIAARLGLERAEVEEIANLFVRSGVAEPNGGGLRLARPLTVDVPQGEDIELMRNHWASVSRRRLAEHRDNDRFSFNVFAISTEDLKRIRQLHMDYFRELRAIVAASPRSDAIALVTMHTFAWEAPSDE